MADSGEGGTAASALGAAVDVAVANVCGPARWRGRRKESQRQAGVEVG